MKRFFHEWGPAGIIIVFVCTFFFRLFFPIPQLITTQDLGRSDAWHFSFATKYVLGESLKNGQLPVWKNLAGNGFPLLAEGQTGVFYIPNFVLFTVFDSVTAYNLNLVLAISLLGVGMYWCIRCMGWGRLASLFAGLTISFFAYPMLQLPHSTLVQATSLMPWLFGAALRLVKHGSYPWMYIFAFLLQQQIFVGFPQTTFLTLCACSIYVLWQAVAKRALISLMYFSIAVILGMGMALAQLMPSWEFLRVSSFPKGFTYEGATQYSFIPKDLLTLIDPFAIANNKYAIFSSDFLSPGNIPWENTIYMGILPLGLVLLALVTQHKNTMVRFLGFMTIISFLFATGRHSPLHLLYTLWPLTLFRVPSRFIWLFSFFFIAICASAVDWLSNKSKQKARICIFVIILLHGIQLVHVWWSYHMVVPAAQWLQPPSIVSKLTNGRVFTIGEETVQLKLFSTVGWKQYEPYHVLRNGVAPLSNLIWQVPQYSIYAGRFLRRPSVIDQLLNGQSIEIENEQATMSATAHTILNMGSVTNVISFLPLTQSGLEQVHTQKQGDISTTLYRNPNALPRSHFVTSVIVADTLERVGTILQDPLFDPKTTAILEQHELTTDQRIFSLIEKELSTEKHVSTGVATITKDEDTRVEIQTKNENDGLLVLADTAYPGWVVTVDGKNAPLYIANFSQRAVFVPSGTHTVIFHYKPKSLQHGIWASVCFITLTVALMAFHLFSLRHRIPKKVPQRVMHRVRSRGK